MDRQTGIQAMDNEAGLLRLNTLGSNSQDHSVSEPMSSGAYPFETFPPQLPDFTQAQASDWVTYEPDRVKHTTLPMLDNPMLESETAEALNNLFSEHNKPTPVSPDSVISEATIEKDENIQQEDQSPHSRRKRFVGDQVAAGGITDKFLVKVFSNENGGGFCTGSILAKDIVVTARHCTSKNTEDMHVVYDGQDFSVEKIAAKPSVTEIILNFLDKAVEDDIALLKTSPDFPSHALRLETHNDHVVYDQKYQFLQWKDSSKTAFEGQSCQDIYLKAKEESGFNEHTPDYLTIGLGATGDDCKTVDFIPRIGFYKATYDLKWRNTNPEKECHPILTNLTSDGGSVLSSQQNSEKIKRYQRCLNGHHCTLKVSLRPIKDKDGKSYKSCSGDSGRPLLVLDKKDGLYKFTGVASGGLTFAPIEKNKDFFRDNFNISEQDPLKTYDSSEDTNLFIPFVHGKKGFPTDSLQKNHTISLYNSLSGSWHELVMDVWARTSHVEHKSSCSAWNYYSEYYATCTIPVHEGTDHLSSVIRLGPVGQNYIYHFNMTKINELDANMTIKVFTDRVVMLHARPADALQDTY